VNTRTNSLVQSHRNRETGTTIEVHDLDAPGAPLDREDSNFSSIGREHRWLTMCHDHGILCTHPTLKLALSHAAEPTGWCGPCRRGGAPEEPDEWD
jgi:hypothetical protein